MSTMESVPLWVPDAARVARSNTTRYANWLDRTRGLRFQGYDDLWTWSVSETEAFWASVWEYAEVRSDSPYIAVVDSLRMEPGRTWFAGARLNFAERVLAAVRPGSPAIFFQSESQPLASMGGAELLRRVRVVATELRRRGIQPGDSVCGLVLNDPDAVVAMLAAISIGAVWSNAPLEFGAKAIVDRFGQVRPIALFVADAYRYAGRDHDRRALVGEVIEALPTVAHVLRVADLLDGEDPGPDAFRFERVTGDHPLWVVYSSGTTGAPKAIVHGHAGALMGMFALTHFTMDVKSGDVAFFYTTTGWIMFNVVVSMLMNGATIVLYDGDPVFPGPERLWALAESTGATQFGASPSYIELMKRAGLEPGRDFDLTRLEALTVSGSPCQPDLMHWCYEHIKQDFWLNSMSGGTEVAYTWVGGSPTLPVYAGEIQARCLGMAVEAWREDGVAVVGEPGELVCTRPFPSMPVRFLGDQGFQRYRESYFETFPGVWRHGDLITVNARGGSFVHGRSDATLNRRGIRIGTAEIYRVVEALQGVVDSIAVCIDLPQAREVMLLCLELKPGTALDDELRRKIGRSLREACSPRHVPDLIVAVRGIPHTRTGKKMEVPLRKLLTGADAGRVFPEAAMRNPDCIPEYVSLAVSLPKGADVSSWRY